MCPNGLQSRRLLWLFHPEYSPPFATTGPYLMGFTDASIFCERGAGSPVLYKLRDWPSEAEAYTRPLFGST